jgi:hypothetical protein
MPDYLITGESYPRGPSRSRARRLRATQADQLPNPRSVPIRGFRASPIYREKVAKAGLGHADAEPRPRAVKAMPTLSSPFERADDRDPENLCGRAFVSTSSPTLPAAHRPRLLRNARRDRHGRADAANGGRSSPEDFWPMTPQSAPDARGGSPERSQLHTPREARVSRHPRLPRRSSGSRSPQPDLRSP